MKQWILLGSVTLVGAVILIGLTTAVVIRVHRVLANGGVGRALTSAPLVSASAPPSKHRSAKPPSQEFLLERAHSLGKESEQLRAVIDEQFASVTKACEGPRCAELSKQVTLPAPGENPVERRGEGPRLPALPRWPEIRIEDHPRVVRRLHFYTQNPVGRASFEGMLLRCGAFQDSIESTLTQHRMPAALFAMVFVLSGCSPLAKSALSAEGMWQLTPAVARIYGLNIIPGVIDERHSPHKSTEAAAKYLRDLFEKFDDWSLAFLAYEVGPLAVLTRLNHDSGEERLGFWDLVDAERLPDEAAGQVPSIEAVALILANLDRFRFTFASRPPRDVMVQHVPPNTRLSLVARVARTSVDELRKLNPDLKQLSTPALSSFTLRVPKRDTAESEQTLLNLIAAKDNSDVCVPHNFDWGRERFTPQMANGCPSSGR